MTISRNGCIVRELIRGGSGRGEEKGRGKGRGKKES